VIGSVAAPLASNVLQTGGGAETVRVERGGGGGRESRKKGMGGLGRRKLGSNFGAEPQRMQRTNQGV
jgi:hypothetical protein